MSLHAVCTAYTLFYCRAQKLCSMHSVEARRKAHQHTQVLSKGPLSRRGAAGPSQRAVRPCSGAQVDGSHAHLCRTRVSGAGAGLRAAGSGALLRCTACPA